MELREYIDTLLKHKWKVLACLIVMPALTFFYATMTKPRVMHHACSKVEVSVQEIYKKEEMSEAQTKLKEETKDKQIDSQIQVMKAAPVIAEAFRRLKLEPSSVRPSAPVQMEDSNILQICAESSTPENAVKFVNELPKAYFDFQAKKDLQNAEQGLKLIEDQVERRKLQVDAARKALQAFQEENEAVNLEEQIREQIRTKTDLESKIRNMESESDGLASSITELRLRLIDMDREDTQKNIRDNPRIESLRDERLKLAQELTRLQSVYTDDHPQVIQQKEKIQQMERELEGLPPTIVDYQGIPKQEYQAINKELNLAQAKKKSLESELSSSKSELRRLALEINSLPDLQKKLAEVQAEVSTQEMLLNEELLAHQNEELKTRVAKPIGTIIELAAGASVRGGRSMSLMILIGVVIGMILGVIVAFVTEYLDDVIYTVEDVERHLNMRVLAQIAKDPEIEENQITCYLKPNSPIAEGFRSLRNRLRYILAEKNIKSMLVTSSVVDEGKSLCSVNLAATLAQFGSRTLLVDGDLRRPSLHKYFQAENRGLTNHIVDGEDIEGLILETEVLNLSFLPSGPLPLLESSPMNSSEFFESQTVKDLMKMLYVLFDYIVVDCPPVLAVSDSLSVSHLVDGILFVVDSGYVRQRDSVEAKRELEMTKAQLLGVILNKVSFQKRGYYKYLYYYHGDEKRRKPLEEDGSDRHSGRPGKSRRDLASRF